MKIKTLFFWYLLTFLSVFPLLAKNSASKKSNKTESVKKTPTTAKNSQKPLVRFPLSVTETNNPIASILSSEATDYTQPILESVKAFCNERDSITLLSQNGAPLVDYLKVCNELNLDVESLYIALRLFYNKMKACELIDPSVINHILSQMPDNLAKYFDPEYEKKQLVDRFEREFKRVTTLHLANHFDLFQEKRDQFVTDLSKELSKTTHFQLKESEENTVHEYTERLRQTIIRFIDNALSRMLWQPTMFESIWPAFMSTADHIYTLARKNIINHMDDVDDLCWSLVHRFCYFLELYGSTLPRAFYDDIERQITDGEVFFLEVGEQDEGVTSKKDILMQALLNAKTKSIAFEKSGLITDQHVLLPR